MPGHRQLLPKAFGDSKFAPARSYFTYWLLTTGYCILAVSRATGATDAEVMEQILGSSTNEWRIESSDHKLAEANGKPVLVAGLNRTILTSLTKVESDSEVTVRFRLGTGGKTTALDFSPALKTPEDTVQNPFCLSLRVAEGREHEPVLCQMPAIPGGPPLGVYQFYCVRVLPKNRLTWPEMVRTRVEQDVASVPSLSQRWLTMPGEL